MKENTLKMNAKKKNGLTIYINFSLCIRMNYSNSISLMMKNK